MNWLVLGAVAGDPLDHRRALGYSELLGDPGLRPARTSPQIEAAILALRRADPLRRGLPGR
ncbi:MAG: hypothetical protein ACRDRK_12225 [Pseudonocardia sp.]